MLCRHKTLVTCGRQSISHGSAKPRMGTLSVSLRIKSFLNVSLAVFLVRDIFIEQLDVLIKAAHTEA